MTQLNPSGRPVDGANASSPQNCAEQGPAVSDTDDSLGDEEWDDPSWRRLEERNPADALNGLTSAEITERYTGMLHVLAEQTHPLACEYLTTATTISPDNPGRDRKVSMGCKLAKATKELITAAERLRKDQN